MENKSIKMVLQITRKVIFEINYYRLGNNKDKHFSTGASVFNQPKTDYVQCGQCQSEVLTGKALEFFNKWDELHLKDLTTEQYNELLKDIETLKENYNYIIKESDRDFSFYEVKEFSKQKVKK